MHQYSLNYAFDSSGGCTSGCISGPGLLLWDNLVPAGELQDNPFCSRTSRPLLQCHTGSKIQFNITCAVKKPVQVFCTRLKFVQRQEMTGRCLTVPVGQRRAKFRQLNLYRKLLSKVILTLGKVSKKRLYLGHIQD